MLMEAALGRIAKQRSDELAPVEAKDFVILERSEESPHFDHLGTLSIEKRFAL